MIKVMMFVRRRPDLTFEQFRQHYEGIHVPLAEQKLTYLRGYVRNYLEPREGVEHPFDCVTELWFDDVAALQKQTAAMANDSTLSEDEPKFMDRPRIYSTMVEEVQSQLG
jgi:uncharacterized protein (TIGR02118 family)